MTNFHTHTPRCHHATGTDRELVEAALAGGYRVLGFADHSPYPGVGRRSQGIRMTLEETAEYFDSITALREEYAGRIALHAGFEAEYFPDQFDGLLEFLEDYPCEYLILGQHFSGGADDSVYYGRPSDDELLLAQYVDRVIAGVETGKFSYVAHPDLFFFTGDPAIERKHYRRLCEAALAQNVPLEVNLLGFWQKRCYPREAFFRIAQEVGNTLILGVDAHEPAHLTNPGMVEELRHWVEQFGLPMTDTIAMGKVGR